MARSFCESKLKKAIVTVRLDYVLVQYHSLLFVCPLGDMLTQPRAKIPSVPQPPFGNQQVADIRWLCTTLLQLRADASLTAPLTHLPVHTLVDIPTSRG
jgi:hypothetical protein